MVDTEQVMAALFALAQTAKSNTIPFVSFSRRFKHWNDVPVEAMPAFFQFQAPQRNTAQGARGLGVRRIKVNWLVYLPGSQGPDDPVSPTLNKYYDALSRVLLGQYPGQSQTLGIPGVQNVYEDGDGLTDEGLLQTPSLIVLPITILTGI